MCGWCIEGQEGPRLRVSVHEAAGLYNSDLLDHVTVALVFNAPLSELVFCRCWCGVLTQVRKRRTARGTYGLQLWVWRVGSSDTCICTVEHTRYALHRYGEVCTVSKHQLVYGCPRFAVHSSWVSKLVV